MNPARTSSAEARNWIARWFGLAEDIVYVSLGVVLAGSAFTLIVTGSIEFVQSIVDDKLATGIIGLLDRTLLILLIVELLYTVQISFREHALVPEPFLLIGLISAIRRVLVITAEFGQLRVQAVTAFQEFIIELGVLTVLIVALTVSLLLLGKRNTPAVAERH